MKTVMLLLSMISLLAFSISCNRNEDRGTTDSNMQREESRADEFSRDTKEDLKEEQADVNEEMEDVREEQQDVEKEQLDMDQKYEDAKAKVKDETNIED